MLGVQHISQITMFAAIFKRWGDLTVCGFLTRGFGWRTHTAHRCRHEAPYLLMCAWDATQCVDLGAATGTDAVARAVETTTTDAPGTDAGTEIPDAGTEARETGQVRTYSQDSSLFK